MSHCFAAFCSSCSSADIWVTNSMDRAESGSRMAMGATSVRTPAAIALPRRRRRQRTFKGNSRNARNAAQVIEPKNGLKINISA